MHHIPRSEIKVLVTGALGCTGSGLVWRLWAEGYTVVAADVAATLPISDAPNAKNRHRYAIRIADEILPRLPCDNLLELDPIFPSEVQYIQCNLLDRDQIIEAVQGVHVVCHLAALVPYNHNRMYSRTELMKVNVRGTQWLLEEAQSAGVTTFLYSSSTGVVFSGMKHLREVDEQEPIPESWNDVYSESKAKAEALVLDAASDAFRTIAFRPNGIWAPGENHHTPKVLSVAQLGASSVAFGSGLMDFTHRDNLVEAFYRGILSLSPALAQDASCIANGKAFFITDGWPAATMEFFSPLLQGLGFAAPYYVQYLTPKAQQASLEDLRRRDRWSDLRLATAPPNFIVPEFLVYPVIALLQLIHQILRPIVNIEPLMTTADFRKTTVDNFFSSSQAKKTLGYQPVVQPTQGMLEMIDYYKSKGFDGIVRRPNAAWWVAILLGLLLTAALGFNLYGCLDEALAFVSSLLGFSTPLVWTRSVYASTSVWKNALAICENGLMDGACFGLFTTDRYSVSLQISIQSVLLSIIWAALASHVMQGLFIARRAYKCKMNAGAWGIQSALLGYPSTSLFYRTANLSPPSLLPLRCVGSFMLTACLFAILSTYMTIPVSGL